MLFVIFAPIDHVALTPLWALLSTLFSRELRQQTGRHCASVRVVVVPEQRCVRRLPLLLLTVGVSQAVRGCRFRLGGYKFPNWCGQLLGGSCYQLGNLLLLCFACPSIAQLITFCIHCESCKKRSVARVNVTSVDETNCREDIHDLSFLEKYLVIEICTGMHAFRGRFSLIWHHLQASLMVILLNVGSAFGFAHYLCCCRKFCVLSRTLLFIFRSLRLYWFAVPLRARKAGRGSHSLSSYCR